MTDHKELLRSWLRSNGYHFNDIKIGLTWYQNQRDTGKFPTDNDVLLVVDDCQKKSVALRNELYKLKESTTESDCFNVKYCLRKPVCSFLWGIAGGLTAYGVLRFMEWLLTEFH